MSRLVDAGGMKHRQSLLVLSAAVGASVPLVTAARAEAISCGIAVTSDVRLTNDLVDCPGSGLVIGGPGITVDRDGVRIVRGTVRDFRFGVHLFQASGGRVERISARSNMIGVIVARSADVQLDTVQTTGNVSNGLDVTFSERVAVRDSIAAGNGLSGIVDRFTEASTHARNTVTGNSSPGLVLNGSAGDGIELTLVENGVLDRNTATANGGNGIFVDQAGNSLTRNRAVDNQGVGIAAPEGTLDGGRNRASGNLGGDCTGVVCR